MITSASLKTYTVKDLAELAKSRGLSGYHSMKKEQLIRALTKVVAAKAKKKAPVKAAAKPAAKPSSTLQRGKAKPVTKKTTKVETKKLEAKVKADKISRKIHAAHEKKERLRDLGHGVLANNGKKGAFEKDRVILMVRDPFWLHAMWHVNRSSVIRAQAAMAEHWHTARPILRLVEVDTGPTTSTSEKMSREIEIHGGVQNWYIEVNDPPKSFRVELGYKSASGKFFSIAKSNVVSTPVPGSSDSIDENWNAVAQDYEKVYALSGGYNEERSSGELQELFEERLRRPMGASSTRYGMGADRLINRHKNFQFVVDAEMIVFGTTSADAKVTLGGEPVKLRDDGTFTVRLSTPDRRQVIPVVSSSADGVEQRTVVLAIERNTKVLEPMVREQNNE